MMIQRTQCEQWFHVNCVNNIPQQALDQQHSLLHHVLTVAAKSWIKKPNEPWCGPCCNNFVVGEVIISDESEINSMML